jgi:HAE1 family hydrophobic/amphiphilic exporter-1
MIKFLINRRITTISIFSIILILGAISFSRLKIDLLPQISFPTLTVVTQYENASPREIETLVTRPIEELLSSVAGVDKITSNSVESYSIINVRFNWGADMDQAIIQTREKVDLAKANLPQDTKKSIVLRFDPNEAPIMQIAIKAENIKFESLRDYLKKSIIPYIERIDGVAAISIAGGLEREIHIVVDREKLTSYNVGLDTLLSQINSSNSNFPSGNIKIGDKEILVRSDGSFKSIDSIKNTTVAVTENQVPITLDLIADIKDSFKMRTSIARLIDEECILLSIKKESGKNTVNVSNDVTIIINELNNKFKSNLSFTITNNQSDFIKASISSVAISGLLAMIICYCILYFFYVNWKEPLLIISTVPLSSLLTIVFMYFNNITLNTMSLGGLAIGVGMVVDSAVVVFESIKEERSLTKNNYLATLNGTNKITASLVASTLTSCVVFLPVLFVDGIAGAIFSDFALSVTFSIISSFIVSISIVPVLSTFKFFEVKSYNNIVLEFRTKFLNATENLISLAIKFFLKKNKLLYGIIISTLIFIFLLFITIKKEIMPESDQGTMTISFTCSEGSSLKLTDEVNGEILQAIKNDNRIEFITSSIGYDDKDIKTNPKADFGINRSEIFIKLNPRESAKKFLQDYKNKINLIAKEKNIKVTMFLSKSIISEILSPNKKDFSLEISGSNWEIVKKIANSVKNKFLKTEYFSDVHLTTDDKIPEIRLIFDREKLAQYGLNIFQISSLIRIGIKGEVSTKFRDNDNEYNILVKFNEKYREHAKSLNEIPIKIASNKIIKLSSVVNLQTSETEKKIFRKNSSKVIILDGNFKETNNEEALNFINEISDEYHNLKDISILGGEGEKEVNSSFKSLFVASIFAIILVYMTMASQFENLVQPFIIMILVLFTIFGSLLFLQLSFNSLNIVSVMGIVMLTGLVVNNGIILIDYYNSNEIEINDLNFLLSGIKVRLVTIINTSLTTILGMVPALITFGNPSPQAPMAIAVIGGLLISTISGIIIIPILYLKIRKKSTLLVSKIEKIL